ncbi:hypothetical protein TNIN_70611 [Trichonephila inaurata madagascariensis]|uniref:Uncharacterized protein n=1 Tax=Trichonephila inaurata madagascariensis TaxID=2747483 RepID=A0A8X6YC67_9ARAC|nr:hypothetical protein TNIN_70611 [Trichonephila inaurata madagascariensis]
MRSEGRSCCAEACPTFPDVRGQLKTLFWEIERRKTSLWSSHTARNRATFNIRHQQLTSTDRSVTGLTLSVSRGPMRGLKDGAVARKPVQHFPDVRSG